MLFQAVERKRGKADRPRGALEGGGISKCRQVAVSVGNMLRDRAIPDNILRNILNNILRGSAILGSILGNILKGSAILGNILSKTY